MRPKNNPNGGGGYRNPPRHTQFKKGQSGNPKGRPKGAFNMATVLERTLRETVMVTENGQRKAITKLEAAMKQLANKAASGDLRAMQLLSALVRSGEEQLSEAAVATEPMGETDKKVMEGILRRFENNLKGGAKNEANNN